MYRSLNIFVLKWLPVTDNIRCIYIIIIIITTTMLTCVVQCSADGAGGSLRAELGNPTPSLHCECVVQMWLQLTNDHGGLLYVSIAGFVTHLLSTGLTHTALAMLTYHTIGNIRASSCVSWGSPGQLQLANGHLGCGSSQWFRRWR